MKIVKSAGRRDILKQRQKYLDEYDIIRKQYDSEVQEYRTAKDNHIQSIINEVRSSIGESLLAPFGNDLTIRVESTYNGRYYITLSYYPSNRPVKKYYSEGRHTFGAPFNLTIQVLDVNTGDSSESKRELVTAPRLGDLSYLSPEDYNTIIQEIALFKKIDNIDWRLVLDRAARGVSSEDYIKTKNPGPKSTSMFDDQLKDYDIARTKNSDSWLFVNVTRSETFDRYADNTPCPQVEGYGWMKLVKSSPAYYYFYWLNEPNDYDAGRDFGYGIRGKYTMLSIERSSSPSNVCKLKKIYFHVPKDKALYLTPEELCGDELDIPKAEAQV